MRYDAIGKVHKAAIRGCLEHFSQWVHVSQWVEGDIVVYAASFWIEKASHHVFIITSFAFFSPRRRSKTPERGEKFKRNVHFQDEEKYDENNARESSNSDERNRQDTREIVHPDGKVMFNWQNRSNWNLLLLPNGMLVHGSNLSPVWNISLAVGNMALEPKLPIQPELIPVSTLWSDNEIFYFP